MPSEDFLRGCIFGTILGFAMWMFIVFLAIRFNAMNFTWKVYTFYVFILLIAFIIWAIRDKQRRP